MGLIWDLLQHGQISRQSQRTESLDARVADLERDLQDTRAALREVVIRLERKFGVDLDGDGNVTT